MPHLKLWRAWSVHCVEGFEKNQWTGRLGQRERVGQTSQQIYSHWHPLSPSSSSTAAKTMGVSQRRTVLSTRRGFVFERASVTIRDLWGDSVAQRTGSRLKRPHALLV